MATQPHQHKTPTSVFRDAQMRLRRAQVSPDEQEMHVRSAAEYPELALSPGEYVLEVVHRHPIGLVGIWIITTFLVLVVLALVPLYGMGRNDIAKSLGTSVSTLPTATTMATPALILTTFFLLGGLIATHVYNANKFYITTESIIQFVQYSLFNSKQQVVNLINVEDVSADQRGILQQVLNYGTLRVSTQGDETIYHFRFVASPSTIVHNVNDVTEIAIQRLENSNFPPSELAA